MVKAHSYVWAKLEIANAANNILTMGVIKMAVEDFLRQSERTLEPDEQLGEYERGTLTEKSTCHGQRQGCPRFAGS
jgi:hypothetical protein